MEILGLYLSVFSVNFVSAEDIRDVSADPHHILKPDWRVFVGDCGGNIKHDDGTLSLHPKSTLMYTGNNILKNYV